MYKIILFFLISFSLSAQNAKDKGFYIKEIHYPEITLPSDYQTYKIIVNSKNSNIKLISSKEQSTTSFKNPDIKRSVDNLINLIGYSRSENPDFFLEFKDLGIKHIISVQEKVSGSGDNRVKSYTGIVELASAIKLIVKDKNSKVLYDKVFKQKYKAETAGAYNNATIKSKGIALAEVKKKYNANKVEYRNSKNINLAEDVVREISNSLKSLFSAYYENKRINLFLIKKEEKFGINNNSQVEKLVKMEAKQLKDYEKEVKESLSLFENELNKITNKTDKKQKKIYWSLLSNISGMYYALNNYDKAIEYAELRQSIGYNKKWRYNLDISKERKVIVEKNKDFDFVQATKIKVPKIIDIKRIGSYRNYRVSAVLEINTINKLTENVRFRDRPSFYNNRIYSNINKIKIPNHYKKSSKESVNSLQEYKEAIKQIQSKNKQEVFFKKYSHKTINENIKKPNMDFITETYHLSKYEATVFNGILEKYYMIIQAYSFDNKTVIQDYAEKNEELKESLNKLISSRNFTQPIETEILLALEYLNTQSDTKKIDTQQIFNILYNLKTYCSLLTL